MLIRISGQNATAVASSRLKRQLKLSVVSIRGSNGKDIRSTAVPHLKREEYEQPGQRSDFQVGLSIPARCPKFLIYFPSCLSDALHPGKQLGQVAKMLLARFVTFCRHLDKRYVRELLYTLNCKGTRFVRLLLSLFTRNPSRSFCRSLFRPRSYWR